MEGKIETGKCPKCGGDIWGVEYAPMSPEHYDGVSEWACKNALVGNRDAPNPTCDWRIGRFCGQRLDAKMIEPRYCKGNAHPVHA